MLKKIMQKKWFFPFAVVLFLCVIVLGTQMTYSAFIRRSYIKAVIATNETEKLFSSNLLHGIKNWDPQVGWPVSSFVVSDSQNTITIPVRIYNYISENQENPNPLDVRINQLDVSYTISITVTCDREDLSPSGYSLAANGSTLTIPAFNTEYCLNQDGQLSLADSSTPGTQVLHGRQKNRHEYQLVMPGVHVGKVSFVVKVTPCPNDTGSIGTDLQYLAARIVPNVASSVNPVNVSGGFVGVEGGAPSEFAAFNYSITLNGAPSAVVLQWPPELLELDPFFQEKHSVQPEEGRVIFPMEPGNVMVQFYRKGNIDLTWSAINKRVTVKTLTASGEIS